MNKNKYVVGVDLCDNTNIGRCYDFSSFAIMKFDGKVFEVVHNHQQQIKNHNDRVEFDKLVDKFSEQYSAIKVNEL